MTKFDSSTSNYKNDMRLFVLKTCFDFGLKRAKHLKLTALYYWFIKKLWFSIANGKQQHFF